MQDKSVPTRITILRPLLWGAAIGTTPYLPWLSFIIIPVLGWKLCGWLSNEISWWWQFHFGPTRIVIDGRTFLCWVDRNGKTEVTYG